MSIVAEHMPSEKTLLTVVDVEARAAANRAKAAVAPVVASETPRKTGATAQALRPRVGRTGTGYAVTVGPPRGKLHPRSRAGVGRAPATIADVMRWVQRGTGLHREGGGPKAPIRGVRLGWRQGLRRGSLSVYGKQYAQVEGQEPNPFMNRIRVAGVVRVEPLLVGGAHDAAAALEKVID